MIEPATSAPSFDAMRQAMVASQLRTSAVSDPRIVAAMARVPRERFVPDALRALAYRDTGVGLGKGRALNLPLATGRLLTAAELRADDRVLLVGSGSGYTAALLAALVAQVTALEVDADLIADARGLLAGETSIDLVEGPLEGGWPGSAPYDVIIIDGAVEHVPDSLVDQLRPGGRLVTGRVDRGVTRLAAGRRTAAGFGLVDFADLDCAILPGFSRPRIFSFAKDL